MVQQQAGFTMLVKVQRRVYKMTKFKYQIETRHLSVLPKQGYDTGKPNKVVFHWTANDNSTIEGEINYMKNNWKAAFVHAFVNGDKTIEVADTDYKAYGAGKFANSDSIHMELCSEKDKAKMLKSIDRAAHYLAVQLWYYKLPCTDAVPKGKGTVWTHHAVSKFRGNTNHTDPDGYFDRWGIKWTDVFNKIKEYHTALNKNGDTTTIVDFGSTVKPAQEKETATVTEDKRSKKFKVGDKVRLTSGAKAWKGSSNFTISSFKSEYIVNWLNVDGTIYIKPVGADWGGNVYERDIEHARSNDVQKDDIIKLRGPKATNWVGGSKITDGMRNVEYSVRSRNGNVLYIDSGTFRGEIYDWDAVKVK